MRTPQSAIQSAHPGLLIVLSKVFHGNFLRRKGEAIRVDTPAGHCMVQPLVSEHQRAFAVHRYGFLSASLSDENTTAIDSRVTPEKIAHLAEALKITHAHITGTGESLDSHSDSEDVMAASDLISLVPTSALPRDHFGTLTVTNNLFCETLTSLWASPKTRRMVAIAVPAGHRTLTRAERTAFTKLGAQVRVGAALAWEAQALAQLNVAVSAGVYSFAPESSRPPGLKRSTSYERARELHQSCIERLIDHPLLSLPSAHVQSGATSSGNEE